MEKFIKQFLSVIKEFDDKEKTLTAYVSTGEVDRAGESIPPEEWDLTEYNKNPVILWAHDYYAPPIGRALWSKIDGKGLLQKIKFADTAFATDIYNLFKGGFLNAFSVGFRAMRDSKNSSIFRQALLLESSAVAVPCNASALAERTASGALKLSPQGMAFVKTLVEQEAVAKTEKEKADKVIADAVKAAVDEKEKAYTEERNKLLGEIGRLKEGRVLSDKNRKLVKSCIEAINSSATMLQELHDATDPGKGAVAPEQKTEKVVITNKDNATVGSLAGMIREEMKAIQVSIPEIISRELNRRTGVVS